MDTIQKTLAVALKELQVFSKDTAWVFLIFFPFRRWMDRD